MDIVISHINFDDKYWQSEYKKYFRHFNYNRHKAEIDLKYLLRSIDINMPFIDKVHLILFSESQIYDWINTSKINIVYHKDIIPKEFIPVFNSCTIEMFLHNIPDLDEEFIYFNDDMFITNLKNESDYITKDHSKSIFGFFPYIDDKKLITDYQYRNDYKMICKLLDKKYTPFTKQIQGCHIPRMYFKSDYKFVYDNLKDEIHKHITKDRQVINNSQYLFMDYLIMNNKNCDTNNCYNSYKYLKINNNIQFNNLKQYLFDNTITDICVNYVDKQYLKDVNNLFNIKFSNKSKFEL